MKTIFSCEIRAAMPLTADPFRSCRGPPDGQKFVLAVDPDGIPPHMEQRLEGCGYGIAHRADGRLGITMGAALRLADDLVDRAETQQIVCRDLHVGSGLLGLGGIPPQDRSRPFR